jgi:DNA primase
MLTQQHREYLHSRGINDAIIKQYRLTSRGMSAIRIPFETGAKIRYTDGRLSKYIYEKGSTKTMYGNPMQEFEEFTIICEGELDALALLSLGVNAVTSTGGCSTFDKAWLDNIPGKIILALDNDEPGQKGAARIANMGRDYQAVDIGIFGVKDCGEAIKAGKWDLGVLLSSSPSELFTAALEESMKTPIPVFIRNLERDTGGLVTEERVARARAYPIEQLMEFKGKSSPCIYCKSGHRPNGTPAFMKMEGNHAYCFSCNKTADAIAIFRYLEPTISFTKAVLALS